MGRFFKTLLLPKTLKKNKTHYFPPCALLNLFKSRGLQKFHWMIPRQAPARALTILPPYCKGLAQRDVIPGLCCSALPFSTDVPSRRKHALPTPDGIKRLFNLPSLLKRKQPFRVTPQTFCSKVLMIIMMGIKRKTFTHDSKFASNEETNTGDLERWLSGQGQVLLLQGH